MIPDIILTIRLVPVICIGWFYTGSNHISYNRRFHLVLPFVKISWYTKK